MELSKESKQEVITRLMAILPQETLRCMRDRLTQCSIDKQVAVEEVRWCKDVKTFAQQTEEPIVHVEAAANVTKTEGEEEPVDASKKVPA